MNKKTIVIIISVIFFIVLLVVLLVWQVISKSSCGYSLCYDSESNTCGGVVDQCVGEIRGTRCIGPSFRIECGQAKSVCGKVVMCSCSEKDNKGWTQVYGKEVH